LLASPGKGLDSSMALEVMSAARNLADHGRTVVCTVHQPSPEMFALFDKCLLLREGGSEVYFGPAKG
ncbi:unnamed protein product, partial [Choristocarpus tenellus]